MKNTPPQNAAQSKADNIQHKNLLKRLFGLSSAAIWVIVGVDVMLFAPDSFIGGGTLISCGVAMLLVFVVFILQKIAGDNFRTSCKKALIGGVITAIPFPLTAILALFGLFAGSSSVQTQQPAMRNVTPTKK